MALTLELGLARPGGWAIYSSWVSCVCPETLQLLALCAAASSFGGKPGAAKKELEKAVSQKPEGNLYLLS